MTRLFSIVRWILAVQLSAITLGTVFTGIIWGWIEARSVCLGGLAAFLPNAFFAAKFGLRSNGREAREIVRAFYLGETIKLLSTAGLFILIFQLPDITFLPLFAGFGAVLAVFWFALLVRGTEV